MIPEQLGTFGAWIEQLIAESTGKEGTGMLPVVGEPLGRPGSTATTACSACTRSAIRPSAAEIEALEEHPVIRIRIPDAQALGAEMYRWEMATAILGYLLDINPFDQPDVEAAKLRAREALSPARASRPDAGDAKSFSKARAAELHRDPSVRPTERGECASPASRAAQSARQA